jgi:hypothetical protein
MGMKRLSGWKAFFVPTAGFHSGRRERPEWIQDTSILLSILHRHGIRDSVHLENAEELE